MIDLTVTVNNTPLWRKLPYLFGYPLYPLSAVFLSVIAVSAIKLPVIDNFFMSILLSVLILLLFFSISLPMIQNIALGRQHTPSWLETYENFDKLSIAQHILLFLILGFVAVTLREKELEFLMYTSAFLGVLFLPAILMLLFVEKSLPRALNPILMMQLIHSLGVSYLAINFIALVLIGLLGLAAYLLSDSLPNLVLYLLICYLSLYFTVVMYLVMGYVLFQHHFKLNESEWPTERGIENKSLKASSQQFLKHANAKIAAGEFKEAIELLEKAINIDSLNLDLHQHYHEILIKTNDLKSLNHHSRNFIRKLLARNHGIHAAEIYETVWRKMPDFHLEEVQVAISLSSVLNDLHRYQLAAQALTNLHQYCQNDFNIPEAYLFLAKIYSEKLNEDKKAKDVLEYVLINYASHPLFKEVKAYLDCILKL
ncbi:MAG: hypothetical protein U1E78_02585 [Gammaproteobacteria bacterium]